MTAEPFLLTERLELWLPRASDLPGLHAMMQSDFTRRYLGAWEPTVADLHARMLRNVGSWRLYGYGTLIVRQRGQAAIIGNCGIFHSWRGLGDDVDDQPEAGWILAEEAAGQGYASEIMQAVYRWFDAAHGPCRSVCMIDPKNAPSLRLADKLGFVPLRDAEFGGEPVRLFERG